jgi:hypothetical protein
VSVRATMTAAIERVAIRGGLPGQVGAHPIRESDR